jgi:hypothetical protein
MGFYVEYCYAVQVSDTTMMSNVILPEQKIDTY